MYLLVGFGVTVGFHRLLTHRSFEAPAAVRGTLAALGSMSLQGAVIHWVADHRKHHTFTDEEGDPHSPHTARAPTAGAACSRACGIRTPAGCSTAAGAPRCAASRPTC